MLSHGTEPATMVVGQQQTGTTLLMTCNHKHAT
jgi:hypothetical protein